MKNRKSFFLKKSQAEIEMYVIYGLGVILSLILIFIVYKVVFAK